MVVMAMILLVGSVSSSSSSSWVNGRQMATSTTTRTIRHRLPLLVRGGVSAAIDVDSTQKTPEDDDEEDEEDEEEEEEDDDEEEEENEEEEEEDTNPIAAAISSQPVSITFKTNLGSPLIDTSVDLLVPRARSIQHVKKSVSKALPGRPPVELLRLLSSDGMVLDQDDMLVDELVDDDDDDDEEEEEKEHDLVLVLDMVPPVDPKFGTQMDRLRDMTVSEVLDAYTTNAAAMLRNGQSLLSSEQEQEQRRKQEDDEDDDENEDPHPSVNNKNLGLELRQQSQTIRRHVTEGFDEKAQALLNSTDVLADEAAVQEERRGQRYRSGKGGVTSNMKRAIQRNLNIVSVCVCCIGCIWAFLPQ